jgi:hypothetical protein
VRVAGLHDGAVGDVRRRPAVPAVRQRLAQPPHVKLGDERPYVAAGDALGPHRRAGGVAEQPPSPHRLVGKCLRHAPPPSVDVRRPVASGACALALN